MLTKSEKRRFNELRNRRDEGGILSAAEAGEVAAFTERIEAAERVYLDLANERLRAENAATEERIRALSALVEREQQFAERLRNTLEDLSREREAMTAERRRLVSAITHPASV